MGQAIEAAPSSERSDLQKIEGRVLQLFNKSCAGSIQAGEVATAPADVLAAQKVYVNACAHEFPPLMAEMTRKTNSMVDDALQMDDRLTGVTNATIVTTYAVILGGLALVIAIAFFGIRIGVTAPLLALNTTMEKLAAGDLSALVPGEDRRDEVGSMAKTVQVFKEAGIAKIRLEGEATEQRAASEAGRLANEAARQAAAKQQAFVVESLASGLATLSGGDLLFRLNTSFAPEYDKLRTDFNGAMDKLQAAMRAISVNTQAIRGGGEEISQAADDLSRRTEQQAASLEETAAALDHITATVRRTAEGANEARGVVGAAKTDAERCGEVVREAVAAMSVIEQSSNQIGQIISVIDEIAFQTNLLALNAGVEAARAGDAGRGFAVVASEVRALAQRSADAAKEIKSLISASSQHVNTGVGLVGETGKALDRIAKQVVQINGLVTEIAASAQDQSTGLAEINTAVNQMDQVTQQNAAMVEQSTAATHALSQEAEDLARLAAQFKTGGETMPTVRHASKRRSEPGPQPSRTALKVVGRDGAALKPSPAEMPEGWEEF